MLFCTEIGLWRHFYSRNFKKPWNSGSLAFEELPASNRQLIFLMYSWQRMQTVTICTFTCVAFSCFFFSYFSLLFFFFLLYAEWLTPRRFHCRVNQAETPIHQTGMCVLSLHTGGMQRKKKRPQRVFFFFLKRCLGFSPSFHTIPGQSYLPHGGPGWRGDGRIPAGLTQSPLMEPEVQRPCTRQQNLKITT